MGICSPQDTERAQLGVRVQSTAGTAETLTAKDFKTKVMSGITPEYTNEKEARDLVTSSRSPIDSIQGKRSLALAFTSELNTPDTFNIAATASMDIESQVWQSDYIMRITFNGTPDLSGVEDGDYLTVNYSSVASLNGTWLIIVVNDSSNYVDIIQPGATDARDEPSGSPAIGDIQSPLEYQAAINASGCEVMGASRIKIGAVTSGPFVVDEVITGHISGSTGRCLLPTANGDAYIYYEPTSLTAMTASDNVLGATSEASGQAGGNNAQVHGYFVRPKSDCSAVATIEYQEDGFAWSARDAVGNFSLTIPASKQAMIEFAMQGPRSVIGTKALTTGVTHYTEAPPISQNAGVTLDLTFEPVWSNITLDIGNNIVYRENGNVDDDTGYEGARISGKRAGKFSITCEHELAAVYDFYAKLAAGTKIAVIGYIGDDQDVKQICYKIRYLELDELPAGNIENLRTLDVTGTMTGANMDSEDYEWELVFLGN